MLAEHDLIVGIGGPLNLYHAEGFGAHAPEGAKCWILSDNPGVLAWAPLGDAILGNVRLIVSSLLRDLAPSDRTRPAPRTPPPVLDPSVLDDRLAFERIAIALPDDAIVVEEAPSSRPAMQERLKLDTKNSFFTTASGGLGYGLPASVGVALAKPDQRVVMIAGDGSAMYSIQALFSAFQLGSSITFIIINNRRYEALQGFGRVFDMQEVVGTDLSGLDFVSLAKGHGVPARCVATADALDTALKECFSAEGPNLIEIIVE